MIHKMIIVGLTFLATASAIAWPLSYTDWPGRMSVEPLDGFWCSHEQPFPEGDYYWRLGIRFNSSRSLSFATMPGRACLQIPHWSDEVDRYTFEVWRDFYVQIVPVPPNSDWTIFVSCPFYVPFLVFAAYPTFAFIRGPLRRHNREKRNLCLNCGYSLTGNVSGNCPECGTPTSI